MTLKKFSRYAGLVLSFSIASSLCACGSTSSDTSDTSETAVETDTAEDAADPIENETQDQENDANTDTATNENTTTNPDTDADAERTAADDESAGDDDSEVLYTIGAALPNTSDSLMTMLKKGLGIAADESCGELELMYTDAADDAETQKEQVENMINAGVDALILCPVDDTAAKSCIDTATAADIPIMTLHDAADTLSQNKCFTYVGTDDAAAASLLEHYIEEEYLYGYNDRIILLSGSSSDTHQSARREAILEDLSEKDGLEILEDRTDVESREEAQELVSDWMDTYSGIDGIVCLNSETALGAAAALEEYNESSYNTSETFVTAADITYEIGGKIESGDIAASVFENAIDQGYYALIYCRNYLNGRTVRKNISIPSDLVTDENLHDYDGQY